MLLNITHKANQVAADIVHFLESRASNVNCNTINIMGSDYLVIKGICGNSQYEYTINDPHAIAHSLDEDFIRQILSINGFRYDVIPGDIINKYYYVLVYEMSAISIRQKTIANGNSYSKYVDEDQCKRVVDLARRTIYLLGLDYGMVKIAVTGSRKNRVVMVDPSPEIREKDMKSLLRKLDRLINDSSYMKIQEIKMGADPEFMLCNARNGKMVAASQFFPREGLVGCDNIRVPSRQQRPVGELRPKADFSPLQLLANLHQALRYACKLMPHRNIKFLAGSGPHKGYSIGGHIHFSNISLNNHILRALDTYVGLPVFLIENQATAVRRRKKYGFLADFRTKDYGGFEYRTPGSWLVSSEIAKAVLCLAKIVASSYLSLPRNCFATIEAQRAFYEGDQDYLRQFFNGLWADIKALSVYDALADEIQIIDYMISNSLIWDERADIRKTWNINGTSLRNHIDPSIMRPEIPEEESAFDSSPDSADEDLQIPLPSRPSSRRNTRSHSSSVNTGTDDQDSRDRRTRNPNRAPNSRPVFISSQNFYR